MAQNKNALIRYKTINNCLRNQYRRWTLEDLVEACSDALYEYEGKDTNVSKRSVQLDLQMMRSDKLGYNAPIEVFERKYYRYTDPDYSITNIPVTQNDLSVLNEAITVLQHFKDFALFNEMDDVLKRLEDVVYASSEKRKSIIHLDRNEKLKGLSHLTELYNAIKNKQVIELTYKSFKAESSKQVVVHPYLLKEYNNRWFLVTRIKKTHPFVTFALDRIETIVKANVEYLDYDFDGDIYYKDIIGVTVNEGDRPVNVLFWVDKSNAPYVETKPLHSSQQCLEIDGLGRHLFKIKVKLNFELERLLLGFGESIEVVGPKRLRNRIKKKLSLAINNY